MRLLLTAVLLWAVSGCQGKPSTTRPDTTVWEIPQDAVILPIPKTSLRDGDNFALFDARSATMSKRADGVIQVRIVANEYYIEAREAADVRVPVPVTLCYDWDGTKATLTGYQVTEGGKGDLSACTQTPAAPEAKPRFVAAKFQPLLPYVIDGAQAPQLKGIDTWASSIEVSDIGGKSTFFGFTDLEGALAEEYPDFVTSADSWHRQMLVRATVANGRVDSVALDVAPDINAPFETLVSTPGDTGLDTFFATREESVYRVDPTSVPLKVQYLGQGNFNLKNTPPNVENAKGLTIANLVSGDQWTALFLTGNTRANLSMRTRRVASPDFKIVHPFQPTIATTPNERSVRLCFNEQLDAASVKPENFSFAPAVAVTGAFLTSSKLCAVIMTSARQPAGSMLTIKGLQSVFGSSLPANGLRITVAGDRAKTFLDLNHELLPGGVDSMGHPLITVETMQPTSSGGVVFVSTDGFERVVSHSNNAFGFGRQIETLTRGPISTAPDALGRGLWVLTKAEDAGTSASITRYDDMPAEHVQLPPTASAVFPLGDGSAVIAEADLSPRWRLSQGQLTPLSPSFVTDHAIAAGFVEGSSDLLVSTSNTVTERRSVTDGHVIATFSGLIAPATQLMGNRLCAGWLYQVLPDAGVQTIDVGNGPAQCHTMSKGPDGTLYVTNLAVLPQMVQVSPGGEASLTGWQIPGARHSMNVARPKFTTAGVFFDAQFDLTERGLFFVSHAGWDTIRDGGTP